MIAFISRSLFFGVFLLAPMVAHGGGEGVSHRSTVTADGVLCLTPTSDQARSYSMGVSLAAVDASTPSLQWATSNRSIFIRNKFSQEALKVYYGVVDLLEPTSKDMFVEFEPISLRVIWKLVVRTVHKPLKRKIMKSYIEQRDAFLAEGREFTPQQAQYFWGHIHRMEEIYPGITMPFGCSS